MEKFSDNKIFIRNENFTAYADEVEIVSPGNAESDTVNFSGMINNQTNILSEVLPVGQSLGLWIKRSIKEGADTCPIELDVLSKKENIEIIFDF